LKWDTRCPLATRGGKGELDWRLWFPKEIVKNVQAETDQMLKAW